MIAFSTISQISYMFLALYGASTLVSLFHIIIHALFKSLLFLLSGSLIHVQSNFQSIYKHKINHSFMCLIYILAGSVLIVSLSKEGIIHAENCMLSSAFITLIALLGGIFTMIYTLKIYIYCFYYSYHSSLIISNFPFPNSYMMPWLTISSICIDQSLEYFFTISASIIYDWIDFSSCIYRLNFSWMPLLFFIIHYSYLCFSLTLSYTTTYYLSTFLSFMLFILSSRSTFFVLPFQYSCFFFKGPIHLIEVYTGLNSYSLYHISYYSSLLIVILFFSLFIVGMVLF